LLTVHTVAFKETVAKSVKAKRKDKNFIVCEFKD
jgi:hypothetical protein